MELDLFLPSILFISESKFLKFHVSRTSAEQERLPTVECNQRAMFSAKFSKTKFFNANHSFRDAGGS